MPALKEPALKKPAIAELSHEELATSTCCPQCESESTTVVVQAPDFEYACKPGVFTLLRCASCGHVYLQDMPAPEDIAELYPSTYYTINPRSPLYLRGFVYRQKARRDARRLIQLINTHGAETIADIGCGDATRLLACAEHFGRADHFGQADHLRRSLELIGIDLAFEANVQQRAAARGVTLAQGNAENDLSALPYGSCDLVIMTQLIEHLVDPRAALERLREKLSPKGRVLIETPNLGGMDYWLFRKRYWGGYHIPRHLHLFDRASLAKLVTGCGYKVVEQHCLPSPGIWIISLRNRLGLSSIERRPRFGEFLNFANVPMIGLLTALDTLLIKLGRSTSNQYLLATKA